MFVGRSCHYCDIYIYNNCSCTVTEKLITGVVVSIKCCRFDMVSACTLIVKVVQLTLHQVVLLALIAIIFNSVYSPYIFGLLSDAKLQQVLVLSL